MSGQSKVTKRPPLGETDFQQTIRTAAEHIPKTWIETDKRRKRNPGPLQTRGLRNTGNRCYRNGLLQGLMHQPVFARWARWHHSTTCLIQSNKACVACAIQGLMKRYWARNSETSAPFKNRLDRLHKTLVEAGWTRDRDQQDPHELYFRMFGMIILQQPSENFMLNSLFQLNMRRTSKCLTCEAVYSNTTSESELEINPPMLARGQRKVSLVNLVKEVFQPEVKQTNCDVCLAPDNLKEHQREIETAPDALTIHIRRYIFASETGIQTKNEVAIAIPGRLNLSQYYAHLPGTPKIPLRYELVGVTKHLGTPYAGHYVAFVKQPVKQGKNLWVLADDEEVRPASEQEATSQKVQGYKGAFTPYILFYKRMQEE